MGNFFSDIGKKVGGFVANPIAGSFGLLGDVFGTGSNSSDASNALNTGQNQAVGTMTKNYNTAQQQLQQGMTNAQNAATSGFQKARGDVTNLTGQAQNQLSSGMGQAIDTAKGGYNQAQGYYDTQPMVASRQELYNRVLGQGGMSPETLEQQKAKAREEYGTGMLGAQQALSAFQGESSAPGLAAENMARAAANLGAQRANTIRDIGLANEQLKRQEQTGAISSLESEAGQRANLAAQGANAVSDLQTKLASGSANLTSDEMKALAGLAQQEGTTTADLYTKLASGQVQLTTEEAKALAELFSSNAASQASIEANKPHGLLGGALDFLGL